MSRPPHGAELHLLDALPALGDFTLTGAEGRHAAVRRVRPGEVVVLADGRGGWACAQVVGSGSGGVRLTVGPAEQDPPPAPRVILVQALPKGDHGVLAVDLATAAGVDEIVPWQAGRSIARWDGKAGHGVQRWRTAARTAAKQSRRTWLPQVRDLAETAAVVALVTAAPGALVLHEAATAPLVSVSLPTEGDLVVIVGPEGGIDPAELELFTLAGATPVRLGPQVLRSSAAAAVALGAIGVLTSRWRA